jgi:uncharacterized protein YndB with AHSA1/START domain
MKKQRSAVPATFVIERTYPVSPERVFAAFADPKLKARWFGGPEEWQRGEHELDFRVGGKERLSGGPRGGSVHTYEARYHDIIPNERIVITYDMYLDDLRTSVSLSTVELKPFASGTQMTFTEQGVFFDGLDNARSREIGTRELLDALGKALAK